MEPGVVLENIVAWRGIVPIRMEIRFLIVDKALFGEK